MKNVLMVAAAVALGLAIYAGIKWGYAKATTKTA